MFEWEFSKRQEDNEAARSVEDVRAERFMEETLRVDSDGHYELGLPWRDLKPELPPSRAMAEGRLASWSAMKA